jgi:hypothetical protein
MKTLLMTLIAAFFALSCATPNPSAPSAPTAKAFDTPNDAAKALIEAAAAYDVPTLLGILGPDAKDLVASEDRAADQVRAQEFTAKAREKHSVAVDPDGAHATLTVGNDDWPLPIPMVLIDGKWYFDTRAGRDEMLKRRIGANELDAITIARGYDEAQQEYAATVHDNSGVKQYAQRLISSPGKHDGLAWKNPDGSWGGPVGEEVAKGIEQGFAKKGEPFHGYYFKILKGQGPSARLGQLDYVVGGAMLGGFALIAWPAQYGVTGIQTFMVSYDGVVYQKDLGPDTTSIAPAIDRYDPNETWVRTEDDW